MHAPTEKQIKFARMLHRRTGIVLPDDYRTNGASCNAYISARLRDLKGQPKLRYEDDDTRRIRSGGPLKNEPGPWD